MVPKRAEKAPHEGIDNWENEGGAARREPEHDEAPPAALGAWENEGGAARPESRDEEKPTKLPTVGDPRAMAPMQ